MRREEGEEDCIWEGEKLVEVFEMWEGVVCGRVC